MSLAVYLTWLEKARAAGWQLTEFSCPRCQFPISTKVPECGHRFEGQHRMCCHAAEDCARTLTVKLGLRDPSRRAEAKETKTRHRDGMPGPRQRA